MKQVKTIQEVSNDIVTVAEAKEYLRVTDNAEDSYISVCIDSAISYIQNRLGYPVTSLITKNIVTGYTAGEPFIFAPAWGPAELTINSVTDPAGQPLAYTVTDNYITITGEAAEAIIEYTVTPNINGIKHVKQAALLLIGKYYEQRGDDSKSITEGGWDTVDRLLSLVSIIWL